MMNANVVPVYMQCSIYSRQEKARWIIRSGLKSIPWGNGGDRCMVRQAATHVSQRMTEALVGLSLPGRIWCWYCCLPPAPEDAAGDVQGFARTRKSHAGSIGNQYVRAMTGPCICLCQARILRRQKNRTALGAVRVRTANGFESATSATPAP